MLPALYIEEKQREMARTPLVQQSSGRWALFLIEGKELEWGHRFDSGIGYRVYIRFKDSMMSNVFLPDQARKAAVHMSKGETNEDILNMGIILKQMAAQVESLNKAWAAAGCPDAPLDAIIAGGNS